MHFIQYVFWELLFSYMYCMFKTKDIEEKAPLLQQQRKDYDSALVTIDKLTAKLENAMKVYKLVSLFNNYKSTKYLGIR